MDVRRYISTNLDICHGKPCFKGTRIMVSSVLELMETGQSPKEILHAYPNLTIEHIQAGLHLASEVLEADQFVPFHTK